MLPEFDLVDPAELKASTPALLIRDKKTKTIYWDKDFQKRSLIDSLLAENTVILHLWE